jgi:hypothetical protein
MTVFYLKADPMRSYDQLQSSSAEWLNKVQEDKLLIVPSVLAFDNDYKRLHSLKNVASVWSEKSQRGQWAKGRVLGFWLTESDARKYFVQLQQATDVLLVEWYSTELEDVAEDLNATVIGSVYDLLLKPYKPSKNIL